MELGPSVHEPAAQNDGGRAGELSEIGPRVGVVDDSIGWRAGLQARPAKVGARGPGCSTEGVVGTQTGRDECTHFVSDPPVRTRVRAGQERHARLGRLHSELAVCPDGGLEFPIAAAARLR